MRLTFLHKKSLKALGCGALAATLMGVASHTYGQNTSYSTDFNISSGYTNGDSLSGTNGWTDTDPNLPDATLNTGYAKNANDLQAVFGGAFIAYAGQQPSQTTDYLYHGFNPVVATGSYSLNVDFAVLGSTTSYPSNNAFGFNFRTMTPAVPLVSPATTTNQFSVDFVPTTTTTVAGTTTVYAVRYSVGGVQTSTGLGFNVNQLMHLSLSVNTVTDQLNFTVTNQAGGSPITATAIQLTALEANSINDIAATYNVSPSIGPGSNSLLFDNFNAVPEPSTYAMLGLGLVGLAARFRRKARA